MTQEEKAKRYDKLVKEVKDFFEGKQKMYSDVTQTLGHLFPELKESEDEKIRKAIISGMATIKKQGKETFATIRINDCIAWLEKQGEQKSQGKSALEAINEEKVDNSNRVEPKDYISIDPHFFKPADMVEPKFHEGNWITDGYLHCKISDVLDDRYIVDTKFAKRSAITFNRENNYHLWTIQDAKDGDVLHSTGLHNDCVFIFNGLDNWKFNEPNGDRAVATGYCCLFVSADKMEFGIQGPDCIETNTVKPATKKQRDLLFQKMKEEGYVWDAEKKQLRKMEHDKSKFQILKDAWYVCICTTCAEDSRIWFNNGTAYLGSEILKYDLGFEPEEYQNYFRLWTIKDAKDGDILASKSGDKIFSYRGSLDLRGNPCAYYGIYKVHDGICFSPCAIGNSFTCEEVVPATKEQRKILFEERTAAGGVLHFNKKELKKIDNETEITIDAKIGAKDSELQEEKQGEQKVANKIEPIEWSGKIKSRKVKGVLKEMLDKKLKSAWSEEDELHIRELESLVKQVWVTAEHENDKDTIHKMSDLSFFLKTLKPQPKQEWSEEDEETLNSILICIEHCQDEDIEAQYNGNRYVNPKRYEPMSDWLKSLKDRVGCEANYTTTKEWKPSDEQMEVLLSEVTAWSKGCSKQKVLESLYNDLKKLK